VKVGRKTLGIVALGQAPRPDLEGAFSAHAPAARVIVAGALDLLHRAEIERLASGASDYPLLTRLRDGTPVEIELEALVPPVAERARTLAEEGCDVVVVGCAGEFPAFACPAPLVLPGRVVPAVVGALCAGRRIGVVVPVAGQREVERRRWEEAGFEPLVACGSPYREDEIENVAAELAGPELELVVVDCMGHGSGWRRALSERLRRPVLLAQSLAARAAAELLDAS
jgi:protein AroM